MSNDNLYVDTARRLDRNAEGVRDRLRKKLSQCKEKPVEYYWRILSNRNCKIAMGMALGRRVASGVDPYPFTAFAQENGME